MPIALTEPIRSEAEIVEVEQRDQLPIEVVLGVLRLLGNAAAHLVDDAEILVVQRKLELLAHARGGLQQVRRGRGQVVHHQHWQIGQHPAIEPIIDAERLGLAAGIEHVDRVRRLNGRRDRRAGWMTGANLKGGLLVEGGKMVPEQQPDGMGEVGIVGRPAQIELPDVHAPWRLAGDFGMGVIGAVDDLAIDEIAAKLPEFLPFGVGQHRAALGRIRRKSPDI